jgi:hypothetical protein
MTRKVQKMSERMGSIALVLACANIESGCDESGPRVFTAQRYRAEAGCLETYAPLALVEAEDVGSLCDPLCLSQNEELFVTTVCPPYPAEAVIEAPDSAGCATALAAPSCDDAEVVDATPSADTSTP